MYRRIPWELVADPMGCTEYTLGPTILGCLAFTNIDKSIIIAGEFDMSS